MISWLVGVVVCIALLMGCGGGQKGNLVKAEPVQPEMTAPVTDDGPGDASLTEELSAKRLEELYAKSGIPGWDPSLEEELKNWEHQVKFDVPIQMNKQVRAYLVYFSTERKAVITRYLSRSTRYLPMIKEVFQEDGLPEDLAYLAMIESGFNNQAYSPAAACGMWQFIKGTGLRYGLTIDSYVDERRDPEKATRAAAKYLLDLYKQFGSWYLAAASYNCGEGRVQRELNQSNHKNFWELSANMCLPTETKNYVPQMIAATIIAKNPEKFGFKNVPYLPPVKYDKVPVTETTSLTAAAVAVNVPADEVQDLNPELLRGITPPDAPVLHAESASQQQRTVHEKHYHRPHRASGGGLPPDPDGQELRAVLFQRQELFQPPGQRGSQVQRQEPELCQGLHEGREPDLCQTGETDPQAPRLRPGPPPWCRLLCSGRRLWPPNPAMPRKPRRPS